MDALDSINYWVQALEEIVSKWTLPYGGGYLSIHYHFDVTYNFIAILTAN